MQEIIDNKVELPETITILPDIIYQEIGDEVVLLNLKNERYYGLDSVGARVWQLITSPETNGKVELVFGQLVNEFDVNEQQLQSDLARLFQQLEEAVIISIPRSV